jgi:hypothetical protein
MISKLCALLLADCGGLRKSRECDFMTVLKNAESLAKGDKKLASELFQEFMQVLEDEENENL